MGNTLGKAKIRDEVMPFINLPGSLIHDLRKTVYEVAEGFGLTLEEFKEIIHLCLQEFLPISDTDIDECSEALFAVFNGNSDSSADNGKRSPLVDTFEVIGTLCLVSGMELDEKIHFLFSLFDFNETEDLSVNEMTLALRTTVSGASKIRCSPLANDSSFIDQLAIEAFGTPSSEKSSLSLAVTLADDEKIGRQEFFNFVYDCAETKALLDHFNDLTSNVVVKSNMMAKPKPLRFSISTGNVNQHTPEGPWRDQIRFLKPQQQDESISTPPQSLSLDWIYGRNTHGPPVLCGADGSIFYPAGVMVVKLTADRSNQHYFTQHSGQVVSIDMLHCEEGEIIASADVGASSTICIWSTADLTSSQITIPSFHRNGVSKLKFSPSGNLLLTLGNDTNTVAIYQWRSRSLVFTAKVPEIDVYDCNFLGSDEKFGLCGDKAVHFWTRFDANQQYTHSLGFFQRLSTHEIMTCIEYVNTGVVSSSSSGRIWLWEGKVCTKMIASLHSPITCLTVNYCHLYVLTLEGMIYLFNGKFVVEKKFSVASSTCHASIDSLCCNPKFDKILIGQGNHIVEASVNNPKESLRLILGQTEVKCFTPLTGNTVASISADGLLMLWDTAQHKILDEMRFDLKLSCIAYNEKLNQIAIGLASGHETSLASKSFIIVDGSNLTSLHSGCNAQKTITACQFSGDGQFLAFGSEDFGIYIHLCTDKRFPLIAKCRGHTGPVSCLDFGTNNDSNLYLRSNSIEAGEACFWRTDGKVQTPISQRQTTFESQSCTLCWSLEGVHNDVDVSACCLAPDIDDRSKTLLVGDSKGMVRVFGHPVSALSLAYKGHSGAVSKLACSLDGTFVFSMSGDECLFQWKCAAIDWKVGPNLEMTSNNSTSAPRDMNDVITQLEDLDFTKKSAPVKTAPKKRSMPWKRSVVSPTNPPTLNNELPDDNLVLEKVHGYDGNIGDNLYSMLRRAENEIVYSVGKVLVRFNIDDSQQQFYIVPEGKIVCTALHEPTFRCAVASNCGLVHVIDLDNMEMCQRFPIDALQMDFDHSGRYLAMLSHGIISLFDWQNQAIIASSQTFNISSSIKFYKDSTIVEYKSDFIRLWTLSSSNGCMHFEEIGCDEVKNETYSCIAVEGNQLFVGCSSGSLLKFKGMDIVNKRIKAHESSLTCMLARDEGLVTGSSDGFVKIWSLEMRCLFSVNVRVYGVKNDISAVTWDGQNIITIGTSTGEIWQTNRSSADQTRLVTQSHSPRGLSVNPAGFTFATTGDDGLLRRWNIFDFECKTFDLEMPSRACAFSPDGRLIAVGMGKPDKDNARIIHGTWIIINNDGSNQILAERRDSRKFITGIKWSGTRIAVASSEGTICVYDVSSKTNPAVKVQVSVLSVIELKSPASHFDFSKDSKYLRLNTADKQLLFYEAGPGVHIQEPSRLKDVVWDSETSIYSWDVHGIWSPFDDGSEVLSLDSKVLHESSSLVCGDNNGCFKLYRHPCISYQAQYLKYSAHAGEVGYVRWLPGGYLISTGESDNVMMIWKHLVGEERTLLQVPGSAALLQVPSPKTLLDDLIIRHYTETDDLVDDCVMPNKVAELVRAHGYQSNCVGQSVFYDCNGQAIYSTSNLVVICDRRGNCERVFAQHETTVSALCTSSDSYLIASASGNKIRVWDASTQQEISLLRLFCEGNVSLLTFSQDNNKLASISHDAHGNYTVSIFVTLTGNWTDGFLDSKSLAGHNHIYFAIFTCFDSHPTYFVTGGPSHLNFWTQGQSLVPLHMHVEDVHTCGVQVAESLVTGTKSGKLVVWHKRSASRDVTAHKGSVLALISCPEGFLSSSSDGMIMMWCSDLQKLGSYDVSTLSESPYQRSLCSLCAFSCITGEKTSKILVGARSSKMYEISCTTKSVSAVTDFHDYGEVRAASFDPNNHNQFATVGSDGFIKIWSLDEGSQVVNQASVSFPLQCLDWSNNGLILVGCDAKKEKSDVSNTFMVLNASDLSVVGTGKASDHSITAVRFSPDGKVFACAASNFKIYVHEVAGPESNYKLLAVAEKHSGIVKDVDFSVDSVYFQGISLSGERIAFKTETGEPSKEDIEWATNSCMHTLVEDSNVHPTCSQLAVDKRLLIVGMSSGIIEVINLQQENTEQLSKETFKAHCGPVAKVILSNDNKTLISIGQNDRTARIWSLLSDLSS